MKAKPNKVLFFDFVTHYGGAQRSTVYLLSRLNRLFDVHVLDPYGVCYDYLEALQRHNVPVTVMPCETRAFFIGGTGLIQRVVSLCKQLPEWMRLNTALKRQVDMIRPDVIVTNSYKAMALLWMAGVTHTMPVAYYARGWYRKQQIPWLGRWLVKKASFVLAVSNAAAEALKLWPIPEQRIHVCHTVIDFESVIGSTDIQSHKRQAENTSTFKMLLPAQLLAAKGQHVAVQAAGFLKQRGVPFELWLAGDVKLGVGDSFVESLKQAIKEQGLDEIVKLLGHRSDVRALMSQADAVILPSETEGFPRAIWEAMILRCPVIATPAGGILDLIQHEQTGLIIPLGDAEALADAVERLAEDPAFAKALADRAYEYVTQTYSEQKTLSCIEDALMSVCTR